MTTLELYRKHKAGEVSREKFLYEVRRDNNLPFITNLTSYDDAVKILKNKGIVTEVDTKEAKADEAVKAEVKAKKPSEKKPESLHIDYANPYEYRHGIQHELAELDEYTDESLEKAKETVLKNLAKDANYYSNLLNAKTSPYTFKQTETDAKGMQAKADGYLKKEAKKDEKANVKDNLGKKEEGSKKPKGVKVMPDKGVTGSEKTIKEGIDEHHNDPNFPGGPAIHDMLDRVADDWGKDSDLYNDLEDAIIGWSDRNGNITPKGKIAIKALLSNWDVLDDYGWLLEPKPADHTGETTSMEEGSFMGGVDLGASFDKMKGEMGAEDEFEDLMKKYDWYAEMSDDPRKWNAQQSMEGTLKQLAKQIGTDKALEIYNRYAPSDRKVNSSHFVKEDKIAKIKEALKTALKKNVTEDKTADEIAKKSAIQTEKAKLIALNKQKQELQADTTKAPAVKTTEKNAIDLKIRAATDQLNKLNQGKSSVV